MIAIQVKYLMRFLTLKVIVVSGPSIGFLDWTTSTSIPITLCDGRYYSLVLYAVYGDSLASPEAFTITINNTDYTSREGNLGSSDSTSFQALN